MDVSAQRREQIKSDVGGLVITRVGVRDVMAQRPQRGGAGRRDGFFPGAHGARGVQACHQTRGDRFDVPFDAADLPRKENLGVCAKLQCGREQRRGVDVGVAMDLAIAQELRLLKTRNHSQDAFLLAELKVVLETDQVVAVGAQVLLAQLHHGVRHAAGARVS